MTALNSLCWCQYFINHVMKQLQNIYLILLKDPLLQIFKFCWISGEFQIQRRACTVGFLIFFLHTDGTMGFPTRLCHSIFFFRNLGIVRELKIDLLFCFHTERCQLWYDSLGDLISLNQFGVHLFFWELLTFFSLYFSL